MARRRLGKGQGLYLQPQYQPNRLCVGRKNKGAGRGRSGHVVCDGYGAISNTLFALLTSGKRVVSLKDTYGGTGKIFLDFLPHYQVNVTLCDTTDHEQLEAEIAKACDVVYLDPPTNPTLKVEDIERLANAAHLVGAVVVVNNTFATPVNQNPLKSGADPVIHSATLGSVSTLAGPPRTTSHVELTEEQRKQLGIPESLIRYSVGIENVEDLLNDLMQALAAL